MLGSKQHERSQVFAWGTLFFPIFWHTATFDLHSGT